MFRRSTVVRRRGSPLLGTAIVGGAAYAAGKSAQQGATREQTQEQRLSQLEQQRGTSVPQQGYQNMPPASQPAPQPQIYQQQPASQSPIYQPPAPASPEESTSQAASATEAEPDKLTQLKTLGELRVSGVLTDAEFEMEKQKILRA